MLFGHARTRPSVELRILVGASFLRGESSEYPGQEHGDLMQKALAGFDQRKGTGPLNIHVMPGSSPVVHDRFVITDDEVWFSGQSLGDVGRRAGLIIRIPDPRTVISEIEAIWQNQSEPFSDWIRQRTAQRQSPDSSAE
jgi:hypothetical protein